jgi:hypothetical protein
MGLLLTFQPGLYPAGIAIAKRAWPITACTEASYTVHEARMETGWRQANGRTGWLTQAQPNIMKKTNYEEN